MSPKAATKEAEVVEEELPLDAVAVVDEAPVVSMFERLAANPDVDIEKFERFMGMQERVMAHEAKAAFTAAFVKLQGELPVVGKKGSSHQGAYARLEDIQRTLRPILQKNGFVLNYLTDFSDKRVKVTAVLSHEAGHSQETSFVTDPDTSGKKNSIQAQGSAQSYGMRYATLALLNITTSGEDDDGNGSESPEAPEGYEEWVADMLAASDEGSERLKAAWKASDTALRAYITGYQKQRWIDIKAAAVEVDRA